MQMPLMWYTCLTNAFLKASFSHVLVMFSKILVPYWQEVDIKNNVFPLEKKHHYKLQRQPKRMGSHRPKIFSLTKLYKQGIGLRQIMSINLSRQNQPSIWFT